MKRNLVVLISALAVFHVVLPTPSPAAQKAAAKQKGKAAAGKKAPTSAEARQSVAAATKRIREGEGDLRAAEKKAVTASQAAARRSMESSGLSVALRELQTAQSELAGIKSTLLRVIHDRSDWLAATEEAKAAGVKLRALGDEDLAAEEKRARRSALSEVTRRPGEIEGAELSANREYRAAMKKYEKAVDTEKKARAQYTRELSQDEEFKTAKAAFDEVKKKVVEGQRDLADARRDLANAQRSEAKAKQASQARQKQSAKKKNQGKSNKTKVKGKK